MIRLVIFVLLLLISFFLHTGVSVSFAQEASFEPVCTEKQSMQECAIEKLQHGLSPNEAVISTDEAKQELEQSQTIWQRIQGVLSNMLTYFTGAKTIQRAYIPLFPSPTPTGTDEERASASTSSTSTNPINETLSGEEGYYGATLPQELPEGFEKPSGRGVQISTSIFDIFKPTNEEEEFFCDGYFPEEICDSNGQCEKIACPITGQ